MRKLLAFIIVLSFSTTEASFLGNVANAALQGISTYNNYRNGTTGYATTGTANYGANAYGNNGYGTNAYGNNGYGTNAYGNNGYAANNVSSILTYMYQQAASIQNTYKTDQNVISYTSSLGNILTTCQSNPSQVLGQLPSMLQYIVGIYNVLNQYGSGANIQGLVNGFSQLLSSSFVLR